MRNHFQPFLQTLSATRRTRAETALTKLQRVLDGFTPSKNLGHSVTIYCNPYAIDQSYIPTLIKSLQAQQANNINTLDRGVQMVSLNHFYEQPAHDKNNLQPRRSYTQSRILLTFKNAETHYVIVDRTLPLGDFYVLLCDYLNTTYLPAQHWEIPSRLWLSNLGRVEYYELPHDCITPEQRKTLDAFNPNLAKPAVTEEEVPLSQAINDVIPHSKTVQVQQDLAEVRKNTSYEEWMLENYPGVVALGIYRSEDVEEEHYHPLQKVFPNYPVNQIGGFRHKLREIEEEYRAYLNPPKIYDVDDKDLYF